MLTPSFSTCVVCQMCRAGANEIRFDRVVALREPALPGASKLLADVAFLRGLRKSGVKADFVERGCVRQHQPQYILLPLSFRTFHALRLVFQTQPRSVYFRFRLRCAVELCLLCGVSKLKKFIVYWLPVAVWLFVISAASGDQKSFQRSSRIIGPIVHWLFPQMAEVQVNEVVFYVRKSAHMTEFGVLALLCWRAVRQPKVGERKPWSRPEARKSMLLVLVFASADELHQCFVPSRQGSPWDVAIDCSGGLIALWFLWLFGRRLKWWGEPGTV